MRSNLGGRGPTLTRLTPVLPALLALLLSWPVAVWCQAAEPATPTRQQVTAEMDQLRQDPDLAGKHKQKTLRFKDDGKKEDPKAKPDKPTRWPDWLRGFSRWVSDVGRWGVWLLAALAVALFMVGLRHWVKVRGEAVARPRAALPSHVRDLDIRPESLPDDVGSAAAALWQRGEQRMALSLLYRGALSRLVHAHAVPIRSASTEGECVALARPRLPAAAGDYVARLVQAWQLAVYGGRAPASAEVLALCRDFEPRLQAPQSTQTASPSMKEAA